MIFLKDELEKHNRVIYDVGSLHRYVVTWTSYTSGHFLIWLINQHPEFPQSSYQYLNDRAGKHIKAVHGNQAGAQIGFFAGVSNTGATKAAIHLMDHNPKQVSQTLKTVQGTGKISTILVHWKDPSKFVDRFNSMCPSGEQQTPEHWTQVYTNNFFPAFLRQYPDTHVVYIDRLLEKDQTEYNRLLDFIAQPALPNWKDLVDEYTNLVTL